MSSPKNFLQSSKVNPNDWDRETMTAISPKQSLIQSRLHDVLYNSLSQAVMNIIHSPFVCIRLLLFVFTLFAVSVSAFLVIKSFMTYYSYEVITKTRNMHETPTPFPKVSINLLSIH